MLRLEGSSAVHKLKRLRTMPPREITFRVREKITSEMERIGLSGARFRPSNFLEFKTRLVRALARRLLNSRKLDGRNLAPLRPIRSISEVIFSRTRNVISRGGIVRSRLSLCTALLPSSRSIFCSCSSDLPVELDQAGGSIRRMPAPGRRRRQRPLETGKQAFQIPRWKKDGLVGPYAGCAGDDGNAESQSLADRDGVAVLECGPDEYIAGRNQGETGLMIHVP